MESLTVREGYEAMLQFIRDYWDRGHSEEIALMLSHMGISAREEGNETNDPAYWGDWLKAVKKVKEGENELFF